MPAKIFEVMSDFFSSHSPGWIFFEAFAMVVFIGLVDYLTGYEVAAFPFYAIPILLTVWFSGERSAALICLFSACAWFFTDKASGHHYAREWLRVWDAIIRMMFYLLVLFAGSTLRRQRDAQRLRIQLLEHSQKLEREIVNVSEREQERIGRDLHDGLCQFLAAISFSAGSLRTVLARESHPSAPEAGEIAKLLRDSIVYARDLARGLSPVDHSQDGLETALSQLAATTSRLVGIRCVFTCPDAVYLADKASAIHLFRIAQEALGNAIKHAKPTEIRMTLGFSDGEDVLVQIMDDGVGFDAGSQSSSGMGLKIMHYRARSAGGALEILPNSPRGTIVSCRVANAKLQAAATPSLHHEAI